MLNAGNRIRAETLLWELQAKGTKLLPFLEALRDDERLAHARLHVLRQLFLLEVRHRPEDASDEAAVDEEEMDASDEAVVDEEEMDEAVDEEESVPVYEEVRQLEGTQFNVVCDLLQLLASAEERKAGFKQVFQRLLNGECRRVTGWRWREDRRAPPGSVQVQTRA